MTTEMPKGSKNPPRMVPELVKSFLIFFVSLTLLWLLFDFLYVKFRGMPFEFLSSLLSGLIFAFFFALLNVYHAYQRHFKKND